MNLDSFQNSTIFSIFPVDTPGTKCNTTPVKQLTLTGEVKMIFKTLVPTHLNDGTPVPESQLIGYSTRFALEFGGCTTAEGFSGKWIDQGTVYSDETIMMTVSCERDDLEKAKEMVLTIGRELGQLAMYFEVQYYDGVQILNVA